MKSVLALRCLSMLLLSGSLPDQLEARASFWCRVVCCFLLAVLLAADFEHYGEKGFCCFFEN